MAAGLDQLFRAHWKLVHGYLTRRTGDPVLAEELAQETFYRATRAFLGWRGGSPAAWLLSIGRNVLIDEVRRGRRLVPLPESLVDEGDPFEEHVVAETLALLPESQRRVLELVYVHGYTHAEVGPLLGTTEGKGDDALEFESFGGAGTGTAVEPMDAACVYYGYPGTEAQDVVQLCYRGDELSSKRLFVTPLAP